MKKLLSICFIILISFGAIAQSTDDIALFQSIWGKEKRAIVEEYMGLSGAEETAFWAGYEVYEAARKELGKERIGIIGEYVDSFTSISDDKATDIMNKSIANSMAIQKLTKKTFKKMSSATSPVTAAKFIQLENYFLTSMQMYVQENLPFIGQLEELAK